ncbi:MAG: hypothetical protein KGL69_03410 [Alphaproteobacteria bacterium]|nr:hypothetical protein [Alphaproteobacteria bacterium]
MSAIDTEPFPRGVLIAAGAMMALAIAAAGIGRLSGATRIELARNTAGDHPALTRDLSFTDMRDGSVLVRDLGDGAVVKRIAPGQDGFVRDVMRGLAKAREMRGEGAAAPFILSLSARGRLLLSDPTTGRRIDLEAFGRDNRAAFLTLMAPEERPA